MGNQYYIVYFFLAVVSTNAQTNQRTLGNKSYEVSNHLGNVMAVVSDRKTPTPETSNTTFAFSETDIKAYNDYYPYGMVLGNRSGSNDYRFGFQGQEKDDEVKGENNSINYKYRVHDPRLGRFFAVDPLASKYPHNSSYAFSENTVVNAVELEGLEKVESNTVSSKQGVIGEKRSSTSSSYTVSKYVGTGNDVKPYEDDKGISMYVSLKAVAINGEDLRGDVLEIVDNLRITKTGLHIPADNEKHFESIDEWINPFSSNSMAENKMTSSVFYYSKLLDYQSIDATTGLETEIIDILEDAAIGKLSGVKSDLGVIGVGAASHGIKKLIPVPAYQKIAHYFSFESFVQYYDGSDSHFRLFSTPQVLKIKKEREVILIIEEKFHGVVKGFIDYGTGKTYSTISEIFMEKMNNAQEFRNNLNFYED